MSQGLFSLFYIYYHSFCLNNKSNQYFTLNNAKKSVVQHIHVLSLEKGFPNLVYTLSSTSMVFDVAMTMEKKVYFNWILVLHLSVCLAEIKQNESTE